MTYTPDRKNRRIAQVFERLAEVMYSDGWEAASNDIAEAMKMIRAFLTESDHEAAEELIQVASRRAKIAKRRIVGQPPVSLKEQRLIRATRDRGTNA